MSETDRKQLYKFGKYGRLELYHIMVETVDGEAGIPLACIYNKNEGRKLIFEPDPEHNADLPSLLPLTDFEPTDPPLEIYYDEEEDVKGWTLNVEKSETPGRKVIQFHDVKSGSHGQVCYELFKNGVDATLEFEYSDDIGERAIEIIDGKITAQTDNEERTERLLRSFGPSCGIKNKNLSLHLPVQPGDKISLGRSKLAMPLGKGLFVKLQLTYRFLNPPKTEHQSDGVITGTCTVEGAAAPGVACSESAYFKDAKTPGPKLSLKVTWSDDLHYYFYKAHGFYGFEGDDCIVP